MEKSPTNIETSPNNPKYYLALGILIGLVMALGIVLVSMFFPIRVTKDQLQNPKFRLLSISPSSFSVSSDFMPASILENPNSWNLTFLIKNPTNDHIFFYDDFDAKITYNDTVLWQANASAKFYQDGKAQNFIDATFGALPENYGDWIVDTILNDLASGLSTKFSVSLNGKVQISHHEIQNSLNCGGLQVFCKGLEVGFSRDTKIGMLGITSDTCEVILQKLSC